VQFSAPAGAAVSFLGGIPNLLMRVGKSGTVAPVSRLALIGSLGGVADGGGVRRR